MRVLLLALLVSGCSTSPSLGTASESGGIVNHYGWTPNHALALAQAHCAKYGKDAVVTSESDYQDHMAFRCVAR